MQKIKKFSVYLSLLVILAVIGLIIYEDVFYNFHAVIPEKVYRSATLSNDKLLAVIKKYHIRSIINLRGAQRDNRWYQIEQEDSNNNKVTLYDLPLNAHAIPNKQLFLQLITILQTAPEPILIHCKSGADRTGLASALALIIFKNSPYEKAYDQVSYKYLAFSPTSVGRLVMPKFDAWLKSHHLKSDRENLFIWANTSYPEN